MYSTYDSKLEVAYLYKVAADKGGSLHHLHTSCS